MPRQESGYAASQGVQKANVIVIGFLSATSSYHRRELFSYSLLEVRVTAPRRLDNLLVCA